MADLPLSPPSLSRQPSLQRSNSAGSPSKREERAERYIDAWADSAKPGSDKLHPKLRAVLNFLGPYAKSLWPAIVFVVDLYRKLFQVCKDIYDQLPMDAIYMIFGLALCFFGGTYVASVAAIEAFRTLGGEKLWDNLTVVYYEMTKVQAVILNGQPVREHKLFQYTYEEHQQKPLLERVEEEEGKKDSEARIVVKDRDRRTIEKPFAIDDKSFPVEVFLVVPGAERVKKMDPIELVRHNLILGMKTVENPVILQTALVSLCTAWISVLATLKLEFARTTALALGVADILKLPAVYILAPILTLALGSDLKHWVDTIIDTILKIIAVVLSWYLQTIVSAFYTGLRGGRMFADALFRLLERYDLLKHFPDALVPKPYDPEKTYVDEMIMYPLAAIGFIFQLTYGFAVPFPLNLVLMPLTMIEKALRSQITWR